MSSPKGHFYDPRVFFYNADRRHLYVASVPNTDDHHKKLAQVEKDILKPNCYKRIGILQATALHPGGKTTMSTLDIDGVSNGWPGITIKMNSFTYNAS